MHGQLDSPVDTVPLGRCSNGFQRTIRRYFFSLYQVWIFLLLAVVGSSAAKAQPMTTVVANAYEPAFSFLRDEMSYEVRADGTYTFEKFESIRLNNDRAVKQSSQIPLRYSTSMQTLDVLEAYTTTKDGRRIDVEADKIILQQSSQSAGAPMFDDTQVKAVIFPAAEIGAVLNLRWRTVQKTPLFPGAFSMSQVFSRTVDIRSAQLTLRTPESLEMHVDAQGVAGGKIASERPGTRLWRWILKDAPAHVPEAGSVNAYDFSPRVAATTFANYEAAGKAYLERARPKAAVTPAVQKLADEITEGVSDRRAQAEALYQWVSKNVRYVAIFLGVGGIVPHDADAIAQTKYGDCKDHVTLLEALLAAKGIHSSPVLVNLGNIYTLPSVAITPGIFNHAISYLPEFDLFADSTAEMAPFGVLPLQERGKSALVTDDGHGLAKLVTLPVSNVRQDAERVATELSVNADGGIEGTSTITATGSLELINRQVAAKIPKGLETQVGTRMLRMTGQNGTGTYVLGNSRDLSAPFSYSTQFSLPNQIQLAAPGALIVPGGLGSFAGIKVNAEELVAQPKRDFPMVVVSSRHEETIVLHMPESVKVRTIPSPMSVDNSVGHYESSYTQSGNVITINRRLDVNADAVVTDADSHQKLRSLGAAVLRDLTAPIPY